MKARSSSRFRAFKLPVPELPEKLKGGFIEKNIVNFWKNVATDYKEATLEIVKGCKNRPLKASIYTLLGGSLLFANYNKPCEQDFKEHYTQYYHDLTLVPDSNRNVQAQKHFDRVTAAINSGTLRLTNLGIATLAWEDNYDSSVGLFSSQCDYMKPTYKQILEERLLDIGFLGKWTVADKLMLNYDINFEEWDEQGRPTNPNDQLKPMF